MTDRRDRQLESAGMALAGAFAQTDRRKAAALLRSAARYLEGSAEESGDNALLRPRVVGGRARFVR